MSVIAYEANQEVSEQNGDGGSLVSVVRYPDPGTDGGKQKRTYLGPWVGGAIAAGLGCGLLAAIAFHPVEVSVAKVSDGRAVVESGRIPMEITQTVVPVDYPQMGRTESASRLTMSGSGAKNADVEAIKARNRRLEALVKVLRKRDANERSLSSVSHSN